MCRVKAWGCQKSAHTDGSYRNQQSLRSRRVPSVAAASASLLLHLESFVSCIDTAIPLHHFLRSLKERSLDATDRYFCRSPPQLRAQSTVLFAPQESHELRGLQTNKRACEKEIPLVSDEAETAAVDVDVRYY